jgi:hypothetical protein
MEKEQQPQQQQQQQQPQQQQQQQRLIFSNMWLYTWKHKLQITFNAKM